MWSRLGAVALYALKAIALLILVNAATILWRAEPGKGTFKVKSLLLTLEAKPVHDLVQVTEATFRDVAMIRLGPLSAAGQANGTATFGQARPGHVVVDSINDLDIRIDSCRTLALRPGDEADHRGAVTLKVDTSDCAASLLVTNLKYRGGAPSVLEALGAPSQSEGAIANADFVLEPPSSFSLVLKGREKRALFEPLPKPVAMTLELADDEQPWVVERGLFRRCECQAGDVVELNGPLSLETLHLEDGALHAGIALSDGSAISCGPGGSSCAFNKALLNPVDALNAVLKGP